MKEIFLRHFLKKGGKMQNTIEHNSHNITFYNGGVHQGAT